MAIRKDIPHHIDPGLLEGDSPLRNSLLIATPRLQDGFFNRSVIYLCAHSATGAMGIVVNQRLPDIKFADLLSQLHLNVPEKIAAPIVHFGGPVETGRGFVLHSTDFIRADTVRIDERLCMTGTTDILQAMAEGKGPKNSIFALGYAGWGPGQLEEEIRENAWLLASPDDDILFGTELARKWDKAMERLGIDPLALSPDIGHA